MRFFWRHDVGAGTVGLGTGCGEDVGKRGCCADISRWGTRSITRSSILAGAIQGAKGPILPVSDPGPALSDVKEDKTTKAVYLENPLGPVFDPCRRSGGGFFSGKDKTNGYDFVYRSARDQGRPSFGMGGRVESSGGVEWKYPAPPPGVDISWRWIIGSWKTRMGARRSGWVRPSWRHRDAVDRRHDDVAGPLVSESPRSNCSTAPPAALDALLRQHRSACQ